MDSIDTAATLALDAITFIREMRERWIHELRSTHDWQKQQRRLKALFADHRSRLWHFEDFREMTTEDPYCLELFRCEPYLPTLPCERCAYEFTGSGMVIHLIGEVLDWLDALDLTEPIDCGFPFTETELASFQQLMKREWYILAASRKAELQRLDFLDAAEAASNASEDQVNEWCHAKFDESPRCVQVESGQVSIAEMAKSFKSVMGDRRSARTFRRWSELPDFPRRVGPGKWDLAEVTRWLGENQGLQFKHEQHEQH